MGRVQTKYVSYEVHVPVQSFHADEVCIKSVCHLQSDGPVPPYHETPHWMIQDAKGSPEYSDRIYCVAMSKTQSHATMFQRNIYTKYTKLL